MASSQRKFNDKKQTVAPKNVLNIILGYEGSGSAPLTGFGEVPLVDTVFNSLKTRLKQLLTAVVSGQLHEVKEILQVAPSLVLKKWEEEDNIIALSGHQFNRITPYQAALSVDDTQMAMLIQSYLTKEEANRQFNEHCLFECEKLEEKKWQPILNQLTEKLIPAIRDGKDDIILSGAPDYIITLKKGSLVEKELFQFWKLLDDIRDNVIITVGGRAFNPVLLLSALKIYDDKKCFTHFFGDHLDPRALLYQNGVIGRDGIQRLMPVNYMQAFRDGLNKTIFNLQMDKDQGRSTQFEVYYSGAWIPIDFYSWLRESAYPSFMVCDGPRVGMDLALMNVEAYFRKKRQEYKILCEAHNPAYIIEISTPKKPFCSIL